MASPKKIARKLLPKKALRAVESEYRLARASYANARFNWPAKGMRVIMITGTNGKTTTAHFLFSILRQAGYSVGLSSTAEFRVNEKVTVNDTNMTVVDPIQLRRQLADFKQHRVDFVILEATSQALDQHRLFGIPCEVAVFTNLTQDHLDYHKTMRRYAEAKSKLWQLKPKISVLNRDDEWYKYFAEKSTGQIITYGYGQSRHTKNEITFSGYKASSAAASFSLTLPDGKMVVKSNLPGKFNAYNAAAAAAAAIGLKIKGDDIERGIEALEHVTGRLQEVSIKKPYKVLVDYAHTPDGLEKALEAAKELATGKLWLVFGACGDRDKLKRPIMGKIAGKLADQIIVTDEESYSEDPAGIRAEVIEGVLKARGGEKKMQEIGDRREAITTAMTSAKKGDLILITGLGHEQYRIENGKRIKWNDADVVQKLASS